MKYTINNFQRGQTTSPYTSDGAFWRSANLDIHGLPGMARINYATTGSNASSGVNISGPVRDACPTGTGGICAFADSGTVKLLLGNSSWQNLGTSTFTANHVIQWRGHIIACGSTTISGIKEADFLTSGWTSISTSLDNASHKMIASKDGHLYICNGNKIAKLSQKVGQVFNITDSGTYDFELGYFSTIANDSVQSLEDFGRFIAVFIAKDNVRTTETEIGLWDGVSPNLFDAIFRIKEARMTSTLEHNGMVFVTGGKQGNIYQLTESGLSLYAQIKIGDYDNQRFVYPGLTSIFGPDGTINPLPNTSTLAWWKNRLMVIVGVKGSGLEPNGIYSIVDGKVNQEFLFSDKVEGEATIPGGLFAVTDYLIWGIDKGTGSSPRYLLNTMRDSFIRLQSGCYFETPLLRAGHKLKKNNIDRVEIILAKPLATGESLTIKYRKNIEDSWTTLGTKSHTTDGSHSSFTLPGIKEIENLQIRCEVGTGASSRNTPLLQEITLF